MAVIDYAAKSIRAKVVYWGPPGSGKWSNLEWVYAKTGTGDRPTATKQTAVGFPLSLGDIRGYKTKFALFRSPSDGSLVQWVFDEAEKQPVDGIVFVVDSSPSAAASNVASLHALVETLRLRGFDARKLPTVVQYNKRDVAGAVAVEHLRAAVNPWNHPDVEAIATQGFGVFDSLKLIAKLVLTELRREPG